MKKKLTINGENTFVLSETLLKVLNEINLTLNPGDYSILLGLNGAGKTTLFSLITRLYDNETGAIEIFSYNIKKNPTKALANIGVVFQQPTIDLDLTVAQNLYYHASLHGMKKKIALDTLALESSAIKNLSKAIDDNFVKIVETLFKSTGKIVLTGIGKSAIICMKISATLNSTGSKSTFLHLGDAFHGDLGVIDKNDIIIIIVQIVQIIKPPLLS